MDDHDEHKREPNLIVRSGKSNTEITNNRRLRSTYCTIEADHWQTGRIARPLCDSRTTCLCYLRWRLFVLQLNVYLTRLDLSLKNFEDSFRYSQSFVIIYRQFWNRPNTNCHVMSVVSAFLSRLHNWVLKHLHALTILKTIGPCHNAVSPLRPTYATLNSFF